MTHPYKLNLVYLIPSDSAPFKDVKPRWTRILKYIQDFYKREMARNGFGDKTFGLPFDSSGEVEFLMYNTPNPISYYISRIDYAMRDVNIHFSKNDKLSDHYLVVLPTNSQDPTNPSDGGPPLVGYVGLGYCFALDYEGFDVQYVSGHSGEIQNNKWLGGLAHELGHGLGLPHNAQRVSQNPKVALMGEGNYHFTKSEIMMTKASCAILNNCQLFSDVKKDFYISTNPDFVLRNLNISFESDSIYINSAFDSKKVVNAVNVYVDDYDDNPPVPGEDNDYYDAESWCVEDVADNTFKLKIPMSEVQRTHQQQFYIKMWYLFEDGTHHEELHSFQHNQLVDFHYEKKDDWTLAVSSQNSDAESKEKLVDGDTSTFWHSRWENGKLNHPHTIEVTLGYSSWLRGLSFVQRDWLHCTIKDCTIYIAETDGNFQKVMDTQLPNINGEQFVKFANPLKAVAFRVVTHSNWTSTDPGPAALAEIGTC